MAAAEQVSFRFFYDEHLCLMNTASIFSEIIILNSVFHCLSETIYDPMDVILFLL